MSEKNKHIEEENELINSILKNIPKQNNFKVENSYFEKLPAQVMSKKESLFELDDLNKKNNFNIPVDYFERLTDNVLSSVQAITEETKVIPIHSTKQSSFWKPLIYVVSIAAAILIGVLLLNRDNVPAVLVADTMFDNELATPVTADMLLTAIDAYTDEVEEGLEIAYLEVELTEEIEMINALTQPDIETTITQEDLENIFLEHEDDYYEL